MNFLMNFTMLCFSIASTLEEDKKVNDELEKRRAARGLYKPPKLDSIIENPLKEEEEMEKENMKYDENKIFYIPGKGLMDMRVEERNHLYDRKNVLEEKKSENLNSVAENKVSEKLNRIEKKAKNKSDNIDNSSNKKSGIANKNNQRSFQKRRNVSNRKHDKHLINNKKFFKTSIYAT